MSGTRLGARSPNEKQPNFHLLYRSGFLPALVMNKTFSSFQKLLLKNHCSKMKVKWVFSRWLPNATEETEADTPKAAFALKLCEAEGDSAEDWGEPSANNDPSQEKVGKQVRDLSWAHPQSSPFPRPLTVEVPDTLGGQELTSTITRELLGEPSLPRPPLWMSQLFFWFISPTPQHDQCTVLLKPYFSPLRVS